ncbi:MAG: hypothetical protein DHS20C04_05720 [Hyphococcus sp.]|nr:MAG: hypothetical protein DHS20C04_05720 [Marinicaulis sp.]
MSRKRLQIPANDNRPSGEIQVFNELAQNLPVSDIELALNEIHFSANIAELIIDAANDNILDTDQWSKP